MATNDVTIIAGQQQFPFLSNDDSHTFVEIIFSGDAEFPLLEDISYTGWNGDIKETFIFDVSGDILTGLILQQNAEFPLISSDGSMIIGIVLNGDTEFPLLSAQAVIIQNINISGDINFPSLSNRATLINGGRFVEYVLRYVR